MEQALFRSWVVWCVREVANLPLDLNELRTACWLTDKAVCVLCSWYNMEEEDRRRVVRKRRNKMFSVVSSVCSRQPTQDF